MEPIVIVFILIVAGVVVTYKFVPAFRDKISALKQKAKDKLNGSKV